MKLRVTARAVFLTFAFTFAFACAFTFACAAGFADSLRRILPYSLDEGEPDQRQPLVSLPIEVSVGRGFFGATTLISRSATTRSTPRSRPPIPRTGTRMPRTSTCSSPSAPLSRQAARTGRSPSAGTASRGGVGETGNLIVSDSPDYHDFARLTGYWRRFKYSGLWLGLASQYDTYNAPPQNTTDNYTNNPRNFLLHRIDIAVLDRLSVSIMEGILVGGVPLDLVYFNPVMIFHNLFRWHDASSILALEAAFNPWRYMELYGEFVLNEFATAFEQTRYPEDRIPNAFGCLGGVRARIPLGAGYLDGGGEFVYVNPWMYLREGRRVRVRHLPKYLGLLAGAPHP